jgi:hypothetical protein
MLSDSTLTYLKYKRCKKNRQITRKRSLLFKYTIDIPDEDECDAVNQEFDDNDEYDVYYDNLSWWSDFPDEYMHEFIDDDGFDICNKYFSIWQEHVTNKRTQSRLNRYKEELIAKACHPRRLSQID